MAPGIKSSLAVLSSMACSADWSICLSPEPGRGAALAPGDVEGVDAGCVDGAGEDEQPAIRRATTPRKLAMWRDPCRRCGCDRATFSVGGITRTLIRVLVRR